MKTKRIAVLLLTAMLALTAVPALGETVAPEASASPDALLTQWYELGTQLRQLGTYPFVELSKGDQGFEVRALQTRLAELGYYKKEVVDNFGGGTFSALKAFEKANGLKSDGIASPADQKVLYGSDAKAYTGSSSSGGGATASNKTSSSGVDATSSATK